MNKILPFLALVFVLGSCKVSEIHRIETFGNSGILRTYQTFKLVEEDFSDKRNDRIKLKFRDKLAEFGFKEVSENPDFLIQGMVVTREFIEMGGVSYNSSIPGSIYSNGYSEKINPRGSAEGSAGINRAMFGKVIFLIQDAKTNEIAWMGVSSGVVYGGDRQFDLEKMDIILHQLLSSLNE